MVFGPREERVLITGLHVVCDMYCIDCQTLIGWKYVSCADDLFCICWLLCRKKHTRNLKNTKLESSLSKRPWWPKKTTPGDLSLLLQLLVRMCVFHWIWIWCLLVNIELLAKKRQFKSNISLHSEMQARHAHLVRSCFLSNRWSRCLPILLSNVYLEWSRFATLLCREFVCITCLR